MKGWFHVENPKRNESLIALFKYCFKRIFLDDWLLKLVALGIAFGLWFGVTGFQGRTKRPFSEIPISFLVSNDIVNTGDQPQTVSLEISGGVRKVESLSPANLFATVDLTAFPAGKHVLDLNPDTVTVVLPGGLKLERVLQPNKVQIKLEGMIERTLPVRVETEGRVAPGFEIYSMRAKPAQIRVRGPESLVDSFKYVSTVPIQLEKHDLDFSVSQVGFDAIGSNVNFPGEVSTAVFFRIGKKRIERLIVVTYSLELRTGKASVLLYGPSEILEKLSPDDIEIILKNDGQLGAVLPSGMEGEVEIRNVKYRE